MNHCEHRLKTDSLGNFEQSRGLDLHKNCQYVHNTKPNFHETKWKVVQWAKELKFAMNPIHHATFRQAA